MAFNIDSPALEQIVLIVLAIVALVAAPAGKPKQQLGGSKVNDSCHLQMCLVNKSHPSLFCATRCGKFLI